MIRWRDDQRNLGADVDTGDLQIEEPLRHSLHQTIKTIERRTHNLPQPQLHLRVEKSDNEQVFEFQVQMDLQVMERTLSATGKADNIPQALAVARDKILSQLGPFRAVLRREEMYRLRHQDDVSEPTGAMASSPSPENPDIKDLERRLEAYWQPLVRQVSREISALEMNKELPFGEIAAQDVVDEVVVRAYERFRERPSQMPLELWLYEQSRRVLQEMRKRLQEETPMSSMPPRPSMTYAQPVPPENPLTFTEDYFAELVEPEPDPMPGDDIAEQSEPSDPSINMRRDEMRQMLHKIVSQMPPARREAIWLHHLDGFTAGEIATIQQRDEKEVRDDLEQGDSRLRDAMYGWRSWQGELRDESHLRQQTEDRPEV